MFDYKITIANNIDSVIGITLLSPAGANLPWDQLDIPLSVSPHYDVAENHEIQHIQYDKTIPSAFPAHRDLYSIIDNDYILILSIVALMRSQMKTFSDNRREDTTIDLQSRCALADIKGHHEVVGLLMTAQQDWTAMTDLHVTLDAMGVPKDWTTVEDYHSLYL